MGHPAYHKTHENEIRIENLTIEILKNQKIHFEKTKFTNFLSSAQYIYDSLHIMTSLYHVAVTLVMNIVMLNRCLICGALRIFLIFHPSILKPNFHLALG